MDFSAKLDPPGRWGEVDAAAAIEFAAWTVDHPRLAVLDAIDAGTTPTCSPSKGGGSEQNRGPHRRRPS